MPSTTTARRLAAAASLALTLGALSACGSSSTTSPSASSKVTVTDAYVNAPTVPGRTGAFATVSNGGAAVVTLTSVSVPGSVAGSAELHETVMSNGSMTMQPVPAGDVIPANGVLTLKSGGYHIMLMDPQVTVGQTVPITFGFSDGTSVKADAMVKAVQASLMPTSSS